METARWRDLRYLFEAVCDQPPSRWGDSLRSLSDDPALIEEALGLLQAQTASFDQALQPLRELMDSLSEAELQVGDRLGVWQLVERLASGGMGTVFVAERADGLFRQRVAIKLLRGSAAAGADVAVRLAAERQLLAELQHPDIARLYDGGSTPSGRPYLVMEYVVGLPLDRYCDAGQPGLAERLQLFLRICRAVQSAHERLVVHCDLKPGNVLVRENGEPVLLDFGIAQVLEHGEDGGASHYCTPAYASPELLGGARVSVVSDVFSLGVLLVELLACRPLGRGMADRDRPVPAPSAVAVAGCAWKQRLTGDFDAIAAKACALEPDQRYASVAALARDIDRHLHRHPVHARAQRLPYIGLRFVQRHWHGVLAAALLLVVTSGFIVSLIQQRHRAEAEAATARKVSDLLVSAFASADPREHSDASVSLSAHDVLDHGAARVEAELVDSPAMLARMHAVLGRAYSNLGQPLQAEAMLRKAADEFERAGQPDQAARALSRLSMLRVGRQASDDALPLARRAMLLLSRDADAAVRAEVHIAYAVASSAQRQWDQAQRALRVALRDSRDRDDPDSRRNRYDALRHLAGMYRAQGRFGSAEALSRQTLAMARRYGARSSEVQASLHSLGMVLYLRGNAREAEAVFAEHLELTRKTIGERNTTVGDAHMDVANALLDLGRYHEAFGHSRSSLEIMAQVAGRDSTEHALVLNSAAHLQQARGDFAAAERFWRQAIAIRRGLYGEGDGRAQRHALELGLLLARSGRVEEARAWVEPALAALAGAPAPTRAEQLGLRLQEIEWRYAAGKPHEAARLLASLGSEPADDSRMELRRRVLHARLVQPDADLARQGWEAVLAQSLHIGSEDSATTAGHRVAYAQALLQGGNAAAAREQLRLAAPVLRRDLAPDASQLRELARLERAADGRPRTKVPREAAPSHMAGPSEDSAQAPVRR